MVDGIDDFEWLGYVKSGKERYWLAWKSVESLRGEMSGSRPPTYAQTPPEIRLVRIR